MEDVWVYDSTTATWRCDDCGQSGRVVSDDPSKAAEDALAAHRAARRH